MAAGKKLTTQEFIDRAVIVHGGKFDYSKVAYINTHTKITIICPIHGEFQQKPNDHLRGNGCYACSGKQRTTTADFIVKARAAIGDSYDFSTTVYKNLDTPVDIICPNHGLFTKLPRLMLQQHQGCPQCGYERMLANSKNLALSTSEFVNRASVIHNNKYDYSNVEYTSGSNKVAIVCPDHGEFMQRPDSHLLGAGCPVCGNLAKCGKGGYTFEYFENNPAEKQKPALLYLVDVVNGNEHFVKIGVTAKSIEQRFNRSEYKNMTITPIRIKYMPLYEAFRLEQVLLADLKPYQFFSNSRFSGYTECFQNKPEVMQSVFELINISATENF